MASQEFSAIARNSQEFQKSHRNIREYIYSNALNVRNSTAATHFDLSGGMCAIPMLPEAINSFHTAIARDFRADQKYFLCEKRNTISPFYIDFDYGGQDQLSFSDVVHLTRTIQSGIRRFYPAMDTVLWKSRGIAAVSMCDEPTIFEVQKVSYKKTGVHYIFPNLFVTEEQCTTLAQYTIQHLMINEPQTPTMLPWASIIDLAVYGPGKGLRMIGASKCTKCPACCKKSAAERSICRDCQGRCISVIGEGRRYLPAFVLEGDGAIAANTPRFKDSFEYALSISSIISDVRNPVGGFTPPVDFSPMLKRSMTTMGKILSNEIPSGDPRCLNIQNIIRGIRKEWQNIVFSKITETKSCSSYLCKAFGGGSRFCQNVMRDHGSSSIYFTVTKRGIIQRCYSKKQQPGRLCCSKYKSEPEQIRDIGAYICLFPDLDATGAEFADIYRTIGMSMVSSNKCNDAHNAILRRRLIVNRLAVQIPLAKKSRLGDFDEIN